MLPIRQLGPFLSTLLRKASPDQMTATQQDVQLQMLAQWLEVRYQEDFVSFFYTPSFASKVIADIVSLKELRVEPGILQHDYWHEKHPFNFPGPFYTGQTDWCGTGDIEAPLNVLYDENCFEYIFRQPFTYHELLCVINAAAVEVLNSYSCNGNNHWTYASCRDWWQQRSGIIHKLNTPECRKVNGKRADLYMRYLQTDAENDLKRYCYFLDNGYYPRSAATILPSL